MGLFTKLRARRYAEEEASTQVWLDTEKVAADYAVSQGAPSDVAGCFGQEVAQLAEAGAFGTLAPDYAAEWSAWASRSLAMCPSCDSPWAIFVPCARSWECWGCYFTWEVRSA